MLSPEAEDALHRAPVAAKKGGHATVSVDYVLLCMLDLPAAMEYLRENGLDVTELCNDLEIAASRSLPADRDPDTKSPVPSSGLQRVTQAAILRAQNVAERARQGRFQVEVMTLDLLPLLLEARQ